MSTTTLTAFESHLDLSFEEAVERVTAALKTEGFGVLTKIDVQQTLKEKIGVEFHKYAILGACNPHLAHRALSNVPAVGLLLPCNVTVYEEAGGSVVSIIDPASMLSVIDNPVLEDVACEAREKLERVHAQLQA